MAVIDYKKQYEEQSEKLAYYENDPEKRAYFSLLRIVNQQVDYLNSFNIKEKIGGKASEDATFARTQEIWQKLPSMITSLNELKIVLKITKIDEEENNKKRGGTTPESIAESIGNNAGSLSN